FERLRHHLRRPPEPDHPITNQDRDTPLTGHTLQALIDTRMARIRSELGDVAGWAVECPECGQYAMMIDAYNCTVSCLYCHTEWATPEEAAGDYTWGVLNLSEYRQVKTGGMPPVRNCPECDAKSLVPGAVLSKAKDAPTVLCFGCSEIFAELAECQSGCGDLTADTDTGMCSRCLTARFERF
ncbi:hypothetical protein, partial [Nonomuraea africana]|uniref:hypothetical protein n=1 Tax=Nonomuraea africana TaxID=46171 RepID=UPI0033EBBD4A